ncbi:hypothetical protein Fot_32069 [Forsythia ovata]|uniref:Uncharacterized protein n=1 Tax=Forsythia ovata TaxID=205694 RepID=A0ABD1T6Q9_9LAMI
MAVTSVYKYWNSVWAKATEGAGLLEMIKMAEMNTARSHVLNCELYKIFTMKIDELHFKVVGAEDIDALRLENNALRAQLAITKDVRARAIYDITKYGTIQRMCVQAQKKAESQLRVCQNMVHAKDKELTEALAELSKANDLLANLGSLIMPIPRIRQGLRNHNPL